MVVRGLRGRQSDTDGLLATVKHRTPLGRLTILDKEDRPKPMSHFKRFSSRPRFATTPPETQILSTKILRVREARIQKAGIRR